MRRARFATTVFGAALLGITLVGCATAPAVPTAEGSASRPTPTAAATETPRATPSAVASPGDQAGDATDGVVVLEPPAPVGPPVARSETQQPVGASVPRCLDSQLLLAYVARPHDSGMGSFYGDLVFTNVAATDCSFDGWPGLIAQSADGVQLGAPARAEAGPSTTVELAANGGIAVALLHGRMPGAYDCPATTSTTLRAYLATDGAGAGVSVAAAIPVCSDRTGTLGVGPLTAG